jgi:hypothetical protein
MFLPAAASRNINARTQRDPKTGGEQKRSANGDSGVAVCRRVRNKRVNPTQPPIRGRFVYGPRRPGNQEAGTQKS